MQNRKQLTSFFRRLFERDADRQEKEFFAQWFTQLNLVKGEIFASAEEEQALENKIEQNLHRYFHHQPKKQKMFRLWLHAAAAAVLIMIAGALLWAPKQKKLDQVVFTDTYTAKGERKIITLSDGSKIMLGNASHIKFPRVFADSLREVFLEGEAFFDVVHHKTKPFLVRAGKLNVQVLGTSFNIKHYNTDKTTDVVVATGKVGVYAKGDKRTWMLLPGNLLAYNKSTGKIIESNVNPAVYTGWQKGELIFDNEPLAQICKRLERWYGVNISIKDQSLNNKKIRLRQKNESLQTVLKMLAMAGSFKYEIKDKSVNIWR